MNRYALTLFVLGDSPRSARAIENLKRLCEGRLRGVCDVEVVDVGADPERADTDRVMAVPTLVRVSPLPVRRVVGDLSDADRVLDGLGIYATN